MQFPNQATIEDLKALLDPIIDSCSSHRLWIHHNGEVRPIWVLGKGEAPEFRALLVREGAIHITPILWRPNQALVFEDTTDPAWVDDLHTRLSDEWARYQQERTEGRCQFTAIRGTPELLELLRCLEEEV